MNPQEQMALAKIAQEKNNESARKFSERLDNDKFPSDKISDLFFDAAMTAIKNSAPIHHRISLEEFNKVYQILQKTPDEILAEGISYFQFGILCNSIEVVSPKTLLLSPEKYNDLVAEMTANIKFYNNMVAKMREEIQKQVDTEFQMKMAATNNLKKVEA